MKQKGICMKRIIYITACLLISLFCEGTANLFLKESVWKKGKQNNYSLRIVHNEEQISKNNATLGNAGYLPTWTFLPDIPETWTTSRLRRARIFATGEVTKNNFIAVP